MICPIRMEIAYDRAGERFFRNLASRWGRKRMRAYHTLNVQHVGAHMRWVWRRGVSYLQARSRRTHASRRYEQSRIMRGYTFASWREYTHVHVVILPERWLFNFLKGF